MDFDRAIIRACDIRGMVPGQLSPEIAYMIGNSLAGYLKPTSLALGRDAQKSSADLFESIASGVLDRGVDVIDLGTVSTDALCFAIGANGYDGGAMITTSADTPTTGTVRLFRREAEPLFGAEIFDTIASDIADDRAEKTGARGTIVRKDVSAAYTEHVLSFVDPTAIRPYTLAVDAGAGMIGRMLSSICDRLPCTLIPGEAPAKTSAQSDALKKVITANKADFGIGFDSDIERMYLLDGSGTPVEGDMITALVTDQLLAISTHETFVYDVTSSRAVPDRIESCGGVAVRSAAGPAAIRSVMKKHNAVFGGDRAGHYYFRDSWYADSGLIALVLWLERLSREDRSLADLLKDINPYVRSENIIDKVTDPLRIIETLEAAFSDGEADRIDGLAVTYADWWFHARPSPTQPKMRLIVEAKSKGALKDGMNKLLEVIRA
jgi:phosphomannomutase